MIIGLILLGIMIGLIVWANLVKDGMLGDGISAVLIIGTIVAIALSALGVGYNINSLHVYAKIEAFADVKQLYKESITSTADAVVELKQTPLDVQQIAALVDIGVSVENLRHSSLTASRIREARDYQRSIVEAKYLYRRLEGNLFLKMFIAKPPKSVFDD